MTDGHLKPRKKSAAEEIRRGRNPPRKNPPRKKSAAEEIRRAKSASQNPPRKKSAV